MTYNLKCFNHFDYMNIVWILLSYFSRFKCNAQYNGSFILTEPTSNISLFLYTIIALVCAVYYVLSITRLIILGWQLHKFTEMLAKIIGYSLIRKENKVRQMMIATHSL